MRLSEFIRENIEDILCEWEDFARSLWPEPLQNPQSDPAMLRDHAEEILRALGSDMRSPQSEVAREAKGKGDSEETPTSIELDHASVLHALARVASGFELRALVAEYRALRASVIRLWRASKPEADVHDLDDLTRFHEAMDQSLTEAACAFNDQVVQEREALLATAERAQHEAESANQAKDMFLATLGHELRTPLSALVGWVEIMRMNDVSDAERQEGLDVMERNTKALVLLIEEMLDVARIVSGKLRLERESIDLSAAITAGVEALRPLAKLRDITLEVVLDHEAKPVSADAARVQQIVWNLVSNAIKFTPLGGTVWVTLDRAPNGWRLKVRDNGRGIAPELLPHVFERFRQGDRGTERTSTGLGLGLSIVKQLAELHGGTVEAFSDGPGTGSTFVFTLPAEEEAHEIDPSRQGTSPPSTDHDSTPDHQRIDGVRVMVIDDDPHTRNIHGRLLRKYGAEVTTAESVAEALAGLKIACDLGKTPHLLLSDICMPELDGFELIREVRRRGFESAQLPAIALTAYVNCSSQEAAQAGFQAHFKKPVDIRHLVAAIAQLTAQGAGTTATGRA